MPDKSEDLAPLDRVVIYTDGSSSIRDRSGGWAFVARWAGSEARKETTRRGFAEDTTNNEMELTAIRQALLFVRPAERREVNVLTDSQYCIRALTTWWVLWKRNGFKSSTGKPLANLDLLQDIRDLMKAHRQAACTVTLGWVPGHSGKEGNELADRLAGEARKNQESDWQEKTDAKWTRCATSGAYLLAYATPAPTLLRG